jgi:hypothetical protein
MSEEIGRPSPPERLALTGELWDSRPDGDTAMTSAEAAERDLRRGRLVADRVHDIARG